jgi:hypothetical protein
MSTRHRTDPSQRLQCAAADVAEVQWHYASCGISLASAALAGATQLREWAHHPQDDLIDTDHGTRCFFHAHAAAERAPGEHGHFHVFVAAPAGAQPDFSHLIGISIDAGGLPTRLFTTNRWVTGEHWLPATALAGQLHDFSLHARGRLAPIARWVQGMVRLYADLIGELLHERDTTLLAQPTGIAAALDDPRLHIVSQRPVQLLARLAEVGLPSETSPPSPRRQA